MIRDLVYEDLLNLDFLGNKLDLKYIYKHQNNLMMKGYYSNKKLLAFIIFKRNSSCMIKIVDIGFKSKFALIKMFSFLYSEFLNPFEISLSKKFDKSIDMLLEKGFVRYKKVNKTYIRIGCANIKTLPNSFKINSAIATSDNVKELYNNLIKFGLSANDISSYKNTIIKKFSNYQFQIFNQYDEGDKIRLLITKNKRLFNGGEINYCEKLKESGYNEVNENCNIFKDKTYSLSYFNKVCVLDKYRVVEYSVKDFSYKNTLWYYRNILKQTRKTFKGSSFYFLDSEYKKILKGHNYLPINTIYFDCIIRNGLFAEELKLLCNKFCSSLNIDNFYSSLYSFDSFMIILKRKIGKQKTIAFAQNFFKTLSKQDDAKTFYHDSFLMHYGEIINSPYLTKKALEIILESSFYEVKKYHKYLDKITTILSDLYGKKEVRKVVSSLVKRKVSLFETYSNLSSNYILKKFDFIKEEDLTVLNSFVFKLNDYGDVDLAYFINTFNQKSLAIAKGEIESTFNCYSIDDRKIKVAALVKQALGSKHKKGIISNPKKLYGSLRRLYDINKILDADFPLELCEAILNELNHRGIDIPKDILYWAKIEDKCSPEYLMAGDITDCCMNFGTRKAITYALEKGFGIISVYDNNRIVSNSLIWIHEGLNCLVLDNIECMVNYKNRSEYIKNQYTKMIEFILEEYNLSNAVQGLSYNDIEVFDKELHSLAEIKLKPNAKDVLAPFYSDAEYVYPIKICDYKTLNQEALLLNRRRIKPSL